MLFFVALLIAAVSAVAGYFFGVMRSQREIVLARALLKAERDHADESFRRQAAALRAEFKAMSSDMLRTQGETLREQHIHTLEELLKPLGKDIELFRSQYVAGNASLNSYIDRLVAQTTSLGKEADHLAKALKGDNKLQGNWGEAVLANLLEASGLTEGRDFSVQLHTPDGKGSSAIPDVVVHLPGQRNIVIDSKVSLKAYTDYVAADDAASQEKFLKEHVRSVWQHVKELAAKDYTKTVADSIGYVLMFIPGEGAYVAAVNADPQLIVKAYAQHVIIINPTNLLMALQLAYNLWQSELQSRSVKEIYNSAERLYKKFCIFSQNFVKIGNGIERLRQTYNDAYGQLAVGKGNIVSQLESWRKKGLTPSSSLPKELDTEE